MKLTAIIEKSIDDWDVVQLEQIPAVLPQGENSC